MLETLVQWVVFASGLSVLLVALFLLWEASPMIGVPSESPEQRGTAPLEIDNTRHKSENIPRHSEVGWSTAGAPRLHIFWPLLLESLKVTSIAISVAMPLAFATALSVSHLGFRRHRRWAKPVLEMVASAPSVIVGALALIVIVLTSSTRALGETMLVLMLCGNIPLSGWNLLTPVRTLTSTLAEEIGENTLTGPHSQMLCMMGLILFVVTSTLTGLVHWLVRRTQRRLREGS